MGTERKIKIKINMKFDLLILILLSSLTNLLFHIISLKLDMSDYSRHTTNKGHLLLNIKPPSGTISPQTRGIEQTQTITEVRSVPYQGLQTHLSYQGQAYPQNNIQNTNIQRAYYGQNYNQQYQPNSLQPKAPANVHVFTPQAQGQVQ